MSHKLYFYPINPKSYEFHLLLKLANIEVECEQIFTRNQYQKLSQNLNIESLPILITDDNEVINSIFSLMIFLYKKQILHLIDDWFYDYNLQTMDYYLNAEIYFEVYKKTIYEQEEKRIYTNNFELNNVLIREGRKNQHIFCEKMDKKLANKHWIHDKFSVNDLAVFSFLVSMDYFHTIPWYKFLNLKKWFCRMKCNPNYNFILNYAVPNIAPAKHFKSFDF